jgi:acyl-CoA thioesterase YciA
MTGDPTLRVVPMPCDTNSGGDVFGGWIMSQVDIAGAVVAIRRANGKRIVTATVSRLDFHKPVFVGDLVTFYATVTETGRTSVTVHVDVFAERGRASADHVKVTQADLIYVAIDENRKPTPIDEETNEI